MEKWQKIKKQIRQYCTIRRDYCDKAIQWLVENHIYYRNIARNENLNESSQIIFEDYSNIIESLDTNLESKFDLRVVFPDETINSATAGLSNIEKVNEVIAEKLNNGEVSAHLLLSKSEYVKDFEGNNLTLAFLRQYPYGIGGLEELRMVPNNNSIKKTTTDDYFQHVTNLSNLMFQTPLFTLVAFNMYYRTKIVQSLGWKMYAKKNISKSIATLDVSTAISALQQNIKQKSGIKENIIIIWIWFLKKVMMKNWILVKILIIMKIQMEN